ALKQRHDIASSQRALKRGCPLILDFASDVRKLPNALPKSCSSFCARSPQAAHTVLGESGIEEVLARLKEISIEFERPRPAFLRLELLTGASIGLGSLDHQECIAPREPLFFECLRILQRVAARLSRQVFSPSGSGAFDLIRPDLPTFANSFQYSGLK